MGHPVKIHRRIQQKIYLWMLLIISFSELPIPNSLLGSHV